MVIRQIAGQRFTNASLFLPDSMSLRTLSFAEPALNNFLHSEYLRVQLRTAATCLWLEESS